LLLLIKSGIHLAWHRHHRLTGHLDRHLHGHLHSWGCHLLHGLLRHHLLSHHLLLLLHCHLLLLLLHRNSLILWLISILIQLVLTELWSSGTLHKFIFDICSMRHSSTSDTCVGRLRTCFSKKWNLRKVIGIVGFSRCSPLCRSVWPIYYDTSDFHLVSVSIPAHPNLHHRGLISLEIVCSQEGGLWNLILKLSFGKKWGTRDQIYVFIVHLLRINIHFLL
jgi:hypothetical protein